MLRLLVACDTFKGTLSSVQAGESIERGLRRALGTSNSINDTNRDIVCTHCPMSDGGAGLIESITYRSADRGGGGGGGGAQPRASFCFERISVPPDVRITGPLPTRNVNDGAHKPPAFAADIASGTVVVEMAEASGLPLLPPDLRDARRTSSFGTGELLMYALTHAWQQMKDRGTHHTGIVLYIGIGGSAINDGGLGALQAMGVLDIYVADDVKLTRPLCGEDLVRITRITPTDKLQSLFCSHNEGTDELPYVREVLLICDVDNPLVGPTGATYTFGPQKCVGVHASGDTSCNAAEAAVGVVQCAAQQEALDTLERGITHAAGLLAAATCTAEVRRDSANCTKFSSSAAALEHLLHSPGGGGAGGMSGVFRHVLGAQYTPGTDTVAALLGLRSTPGAGAGGQPRGLLYDGDVSFDAVVTGEGSLDSQTFASHKTVGRLFELVVDANLCILGQRGKSKKRLMKDFIIVCGRSAFSFQLEINKVVMQAIASVFPVFAAGSRAEEGDAVVWQAIPKVTVVSLTDETAPVHFSASEAMARAAYCVEEAVSHTMLF